MRFKTIKSTICRIGIMTVWPQVSEVARLRIQDGTHADILPVLQVNSTPCTVPYTRLRLITKDCIYLVGNPGRAPLQL